MTARLARASAVLRALALRTGRPPEPVRAALRAHAWSQAGSGAPPSADGRWFRVGNAEGDRAKVYIYDYIDMWGVTAQDFAAALDVITAPNIDLHVNSPGGDVWDANAIYQALKSHPADVTVHVDGVAASAASFIAMAGDDIAIAKPARMMIHDASTYASGNAMDLRLVADQLDEISQGIAELYADRAGSTAAAWREAMQANAGFGTWYSASQAVDAGLADRIDDGSTPASTPAEPATEPAEQGTEDGGADNALSQIVRARARVHLGRGVK